jgi:hypothetical protein
MSTEVPQSDIAALEAEIISQTAIFNQLRLSGQPFDEAKDALAEFEEKIGSIEE